MKKIISLLCFCICTFSISAFATSCNGDEGDEDNGDEIIEDTGGNTGETTEEYKLQSSMQGSKDLVGKDYKAIHNYMRTLGWDYSEHPNSAENDDPNGIHCEVVYDEDIEQYVFQFLIHANAEVLDGDRGKKIDRQRNEMKSQTSAQWYKMNGNWDEWQKLQWKFRIPKGFQPSSSFTHIHQIKAQEGNNGSPVITITLRANSDGSNKRVQVIHNGDSKATNKGTIVDNVPLSYFEDQWVQVTTVMHYTHEGYFSIKIERIDDGKVLMDKEMTNIDMWRNGAISLRNKFGIYRSYGKTLESEDDRPSNGIKDESLRLADFFVYEKNTNPQPTAHE